MKLKTSILAKTLAWFLIAVSGLGLVANGVLAVSMEISGFYDRTFAEIREEYFDSYYDRYSARVLEYLYSDDKGNTNQDYFKNKNFRYGVIEADFWKEIQDLDLNDKKNYIDSNFDFEKELSLEDLHVFQCTINENTRFVSNSPNSLWGYYWIHNTDNSWNAYYLNRFIYDVERGIFFAEAEGKYYPVPKVIFNIVCRDGKIEQGFEFDYQNVSYHLRPNVNIVEEVPFGKQQYDTALEVDINTDSSKEEIELLLEELREASKEKGISLLELETSPLGEANWNGISFLSRVENYEAAENENEYANQTEEDISAITVYSSITEVSYDALPSDMVLENLKQQVRMNAEEMLVYVKPAELKSNSYYVLSYQEDGFVYETGLPSGTNDVFEMFDDVVGTIYSMRYDVFGIFFACLLVFAASFVFLCCGAGYKKGQETLTEVPINRVPLELYAVALYIAEAFFIVCLAEATSEIRGIGDIFWIVVMVTLVLLGGLLAVAAALEIVTRVKLQVLWKHTICYWIISKLFGGCKQMVLFASSHINLVWKAVLGLGANAAIDFFIILMTHENGGFAVILFLLKNALLFLFVLSGVVQLKKLKDAGEHMATGALTYRVDTKGMFWEFKKHGEHLNSVGEGLSLAVEERMKSERFKTELITNVSHDIKTPLTSIINYVDLIQKEEVENAKIEEYLEVLERQSKRLKKLLEDLLEASKASAGTLSMELEKLEAGVFLVQTVGEFEEKTKAQQLELLIKKPEEPIYIHADGKHFWRVIDNLMNNICKYAQPNTRVYINLEVVKDEVFITFRNTSRYPLNITSEELRERFVRGDESRHTEGSGLGLSIAQSLMELMHGRFELVVDGDLFKVILIFQRVQ